MTIQYKFNKDKKLTLIKAPFNGGQGKGGVELGPDSLIEHGLIDDLKTLGWDIKIESPIEKIIDSENSSEYSNDIYENCKKPKFVSNACENIYRSYLNSVDENRFPLTVGGDHSIGMSTISAFVTKNPNGGILWIDAHADINTPSTTESGNLHGCPVAFAMGLDQSNWPPHFKWLADIPHVKPEQIAYIGLRDVDEGEKKILRDLNISAFSMYHVDKYGINKVVEMALKKINPTGEEPIHISYDVDAMDPLFVPATGTPVRGGLTLREGLFIMECVAESGNLAGLDVVEVNPALASTDIHVLDTVSAGCAVARCGLGETLL
ncbi:unnamed protein product [[Candida] boidinii]|uniref:Arginase n=1 Tax=Candida boidinii TaxID=5477 RepID=A0A9W6WAL2_CANBO|nr:hypothetical protein BVG19_g1908 [[Candida] boidinii]OWB53416.1 hypothetical protein B5S27_g5012 [[Candida] boidinii]OWB69372.1 hypothetical protein B5S30_g4779 [[Candida] boidinii]GME72352.1 unnamed protein product [[Candida] boidinii]GME98931.1 unnamed protein product [[Candida] boidinii]